MYDTIKKFRCICGYPKCIEHRKTAEMYWLKCDVCICILWLDAKHRECEITPVEKQYAKVINKASETSSTVTDDMVKSEEDIRKFSNNLWLADSI